MKNRHELGDFPGGPVVRSTHFHCREKQGWILGWITKICLVTQSKKKKAGITDTGFNMDKPY